MTSFETDSTGRPLEGLKIDPLGFCVDIIVAKPIYPGMSV